MYIDFSKAFDSIVISKLIFKLKTYGISGLLLGWIHRFLHDRTQCVVVDHCLCNRKHQSFFRPNGPTLNRPMVLNDIQNNKTHLKTIEVVSFQQNTLLAKKYINIHVRNCRSPTIFRDITSDPASTGRESGDERGQDEKGKRERRREGMKGRKWNRREGRREGVT